MNILVTTNQLTMGGAEQFVVRLSNELVRRGYGVVVATDAGDLAGLLDASIPLIRVPGRAKSPWGILSLAHRFRAILTEHRIDLVHANSPTTALAASLARQNARIPVIASAHGVWNNLTRPAAALLFGLGADRIVGCSQAITSELVRAGLPRRKAGTIHNGIPLRAASPERRETLRQEFSVPEGGTVILTAARLANQKGIAYLLSAMPMILSECPNTRVWLAGDGPLRGMLEARAQELHVQHAVRFLGNRGDVPDLLRAADIFCLPSISEGLPLSIAEAMAASLPVVATTVGGVPEIVRNGLTGWLVPPCQPSLLANRLLSLVRDP
ncbi:MAG: glycosyltransferase, partial [Bacteroidota bacterium]